MSLFQLRPLFCPNNHHLKGGLTPCNQLIFPIIIPTILILHRFESIYFTQNMTFLLPWKTLLYEEIASKRKQYPGPPSKIFPNKRDTTSSLVRGAWLDVGGPAAYWAGVCFCFCNKVRFLWQQRLVEITPSSIFSSLLILRPVKSLWPP